ncbi:MAG: metallophosphoesterase [Bacteroidetes bacterium]|jgi:predicted MPP superfamily phosphohydrolase|nr:metallophosphoesterase [Bacteroidota bacterium]
MRSIVGPIIIFSLFILADLYFFQAVKTIVRDASPQRQTLVKYIYWITSAFTLCTFLAMMLFPALRMNKVFTTYFGAFAFILGIVKLLGALILLVEDITRAFRFLFELIRSKTNPEHGESVRISRLKFFSYVSLTFAAVPFLSFMYGIFKGAYKYTIHRTNLKSGKIPAAFNGLKIVQISDIHTGSFTDTAGLEKAFNIVMKEKPDIIFFTGDLVNNIYTETEGFLDTYRKLKAPMGVYSIFGNHDYGDYIQWDSKDAQLKAQAELRNVHKEAGWRLLWDELVELEKGGEKIALMGIQNWGAKGFTKYGDLSKAYTGAEKYPFKILLSHDPSHWDHQVTTDYKDIDLTLSGHTHGMQFGIEIPGLKWSPVKYMYPNWAGLYQQGEQYLYVNRGLGFLGYPGRVGIWPEITVITLQST